MAKTGNFLESLTKGEGFYFWNISIYSLYMQTIYCTYCYPEKLSESSTLWEFVTIYTSAIQNMNMPTDSLVGKYSVSLREMSSVLIRPLSTSTQMWMYLPSLHSHTLTQADNVLSISRVSYSRPMGLQRSDLSKIRALLAISRAHGKDITHTTCS